MSDIIQLKITLQETKPPIWRRVLVDKRTTFFALHEIIQIVMGWEDDHLYEFKVKDYRIADPDEEFGGFSFGNTKFVDAATVTLEKTDLTTKNKFEYTYDFGDNWRHQILVEKFLPRDEKRKYPVCIDGELNGPPEDCGGVGGFYEILEIITDKQNPERKEMLEWLGGRYNPEQFNINKINKELASLAKYLK
jgi:Plasmid pRiA4b ORF-3-like protein